MVHIYRAGAKKLDLDITNCNIIEMINAWHSIMGDCVTDKKKKNTNIYTHTHTHIDADAPVEWPTVSWWNSMYAKLIFLGNFNSGQSSVYS